MNTVPYTEILTSRLEVYFFVIFSCFPFNPDLFLQVIQNLGAADVDTRLEEQLIDGILFAFQEQVTATR